VRRRLVVLGVLVVVVVASAVWWTSSGEGFPRYISWCDRDYERGDAPTIDGDALFTSVAKTPDGDDVLATEGVSCGHGLAPTILIVDHDGESRQYSLLGAP
jgi:hypothetical protein